MADGPKRKRFEGFGRRLLGSSLGVGANNNKSNESILFSRNIIPVEKHIPCRGTAAVHCITLHESVGNPGHSSRSLRNHISFAMQIVVRKRPSEIVRAESGTPGWVCWHGPPWGGPWAPLGALSPARGQAARFIGFGPSWPTG